ncbi:hypothetical protein CEUSTIGMA_g1375.t1 [Chlamydomonas eustigma]|uniref:Ribosome biogenesis regulatory protein n=1 Tax=Chlamydomonas eustigma TaxID=1157962 RepID=A0A250WSX4_9CHLO|nr:hypothetical protein CEUSTIGMA_g1375.t1 [Chlamydomonas eustigma]|eukprot:GAX73925.1 hypothetical protein CEUSTIGMA_g1375.t1 [Chlamydomonas eustigma]
MEVSPIKVTAEQLGISIGEEYDGQLEYDVGNLSAFDPAPVDLEKLQGDTREEALLETAQAITQSLVNKLFSLPAEAMKDGRLATLPAPITVLPREKPLPKPKPLTKWQKFAQEKGITKRKRSKLAFDEASGDWKRRHGYGRANDEIDVPIIEAKPTDKVGEDPFTALAAARKERVARNKKQHAGNVKEALKKGGSLPATLKLSAALPEGDKRGEKKKRKELKAEITGAHLLAGVSTASMGKFDKRLKDEKEGERNITGKRRKFMPVTDTNTERAQLTGLADKFLRERSEDILDIRKAIGRFESESQNDSKPSKTSGSSSGGTKGQKRGGGRGGGFGGGGRGGKSRGGGRGGGGRAGAGERGGSADRSEGKGRGGGRGGRGGGRRGGRGRGR